MSAAGELHGYYLFEVERDARCFYIACQSPDGPSVACETSMSALTRRLEMSQHSAWLKPEPEPETVALTPEQLHALRAMAMFNGEAGG